MTNAEKNEAVAKIDGYYCIQTPPSPRDAVQKHYCQWRNPRTMQTSLELPDYFNPYHGYTLLIGVIQRMDLNTRGGLAIKIHDIRMGLEEPSSDKMIMFPRVASELWMATQDELVDSIISVCQTQQ